MEGVQLPYTIPTRWGMVLDKGLPTTQWRSQDNVGRPEKETLDKHAIVTLPSLGNALGMVLPPTCRAHMRELTRLRRRLGDTTWHISSFRDFVETDWSNGRHAAIAETAIACVRADRKPDSRLVRGSDADRDRFTANVLACRDERHDIYRLTTYIKSRARLGLERAAAAVVSAFVNHGRLDDAAALLREMTGVLAASYMDGSGSGGGATDLCRNTLAQGRAEALAAAAATARLLCSKAAARRGEQPLAAGVPRTYRQFVQLLLRVRSVRPRSYERCLFIPAWLFEEAGIQPTGGHAAHLNGYQAMLKRVGEEKAVVKGYRWPVNAAAEDSIVLSKHFFRVLQRRVLNLYRFLDPAVRLRVKVRQMEERVLYGSTRMDRLLRETDDVAVVAFFFFAIQRKLQLKVVSDDESTRFLAKGEGGLLYQNNPRVIATFEEALARIAGLKPDSLSTAGDEDTLELIDGTCLLMKEYVDVHGDGKKENLVFKKGVAGGTGRGPVDEYNLLCDVLRDLKARAREDGIKDLPGPVYKFLAKDIMYWNESWDDDAFANDRVHGWEEWVVERGLI